MAQNDRPDLHDALAGAETTAGTTAVLQALMSVLGDALDRMDARMANLEDALVAHDAHDAASATDDKVDNVLVSLEGLSRRLERLEARDGPEAAAQATMTRLADLSSAVDTIGEGLNRLAELVTASSDGLGEWPEEFHRALSDLAVGVSDLRRDVPLQPVADLQEVVGRLESQVSSIGAEVTAARASDDGPQLASLTSAVESLGQRLETLETGGPGGEALERAMIRLDELSGAVDSIGYGLAGMADILAASHGGGGSWSEELRTAISDLGAGVAELRRREVDVPPLGELQEAVSRLESEMASVAAQITSQPGPGAALAMVAAGLAERFEERTQAITDLLESHAAYVRETWERIDDLLDGGSFDELAVSNALDHVIDNQERMADSMDELSGLMEVVRERPGSGTDAVAHEALASLGAGMEGIGARVDDVRRRLAALANALGTATDVPGPRQPQHDPDPSDPNAPLGRRPSGTGRRLGGDLGLRGRGRQR